MSRRPKRSLAWTALIGASLVTLGSQAIQRSPVSQEKPASPPSNRALAHEPRQAYREETFALLSERAKPHVLRAGVRHVYRVGLKPGQFLRVVLRQEGIDVRLELRAPGEQLLLTADTPNGNRGSESALWVAEKPGMYRLAISTSEEPSASARYVIAQVERRRATEGDRRRTLALRTYYHARDLSRQEGWDSERVRAELQRAVGLMDKDGDLEPRAYAWAELGKACLKQRQWPKARDAYRRAALLFRSLGRKDREAHAIAELAHSEEYIPDIESARRHFEKARELAAEARDEKNEANILNNLGMLHAERAEAWEASRSLADALLIWRRLRDHDGEATALVALALLYTQMGQLDQALETYQSALRLSQVSSVVRASVLTQMGNALVYEHRPERAFQFLQEALAIDQHEVHDQGVEANILVGLGLAYVAIGSFSDAVNSYERALKIFQAKSDLRGQAITSMNIGWALGSLRRYDEALQPFHQALEIARKLNNRGLEAGVLLGYAWTERRRGYLSEAQRQAERSLKLVEALRSETGETDLRISFFSGKQDVYELLIGILMDRYKVQGSLDAVLKALGVSESARARGLLDNLGTRGPPVQAWRATGIAATVLSARDIQKGVLDPDTILLEYSFGRPASYLWLVTQTDVQAFELPGRAVLEELVKDSYEALAKSHLQEEQAGAIAKARELSRVLLGPVASRLGKKRLLIVGPGVLQSIPFAALPDPSELTSPIDPERPWPEPLLLHHEILIEPSASVLAEIRRLRASRRPGKKLLAALADAVFERDDPRLAKISIASRSASDLVLGHLDRLPASREEAETITAGLPAAQVLKALDFNANRDLVVNGGVDDYRVVHIATHTFFQARPELVAIVLSRYDERGRARNGLLRIADIRSLSLHSDLVVLSSCSSALGRDVLGEGVMGLPQAFLSAGVSQVAMTVWDIGDESTADLMRRFYGNIFRRGKPPSLALREAQIAIWKEPGHSAPWFWAGFIAQGEWKLEVSGSLNKIPPSVSPKQGEPKSLAPTRNPPAPPRR